MEFLDFAGSRRHLTWKRTPVYAKDSDRELAELESNRPDSSHSSSSQKEDTNFGDALFAPSFVPKSPFDKLRTFSWKVFGKRPVTLGRTVSSSPVPSSPILTPEDHNDHKAWNLLHVMAGGQSFYCPEWIFDAHPESLMGDVERRGFFFHQKHQCYMFPEILPDIFSAILQYYQTGSLVRPERLSLNYFLEYVDLFDLDTEAVDDLLKREGLRKLHRETESLDKKPSFRSRMWDVLDHPWSGMTARVYSYVSLFLTVLSVTLYIIETLPELHHMGLTYKTSLKEAFSSPLIVINTVCFAFFCVEFICRLLCCPSRRAFIRSWTTWTDFLSLVPFAVMLLLVHLRSRTALPTKSLNALRGLRLVLIARIVGTTRFYRHHWVAVLAQTLRNNIQTLFVLFFLLMICMVGFGGLMYALEGVGQEDANIESIPMGMWWAVVTLTTVGYGDVVPKRALGQINAVICGCCGLVLTGFVLESITFEYRRLMKNNTEYWRYTADLGHHSSRHPALRKPSARRLSIRASIIGLGLQGTGHEAEIQIDINGSQFFLALEDLNKHPNSLLGHPAKRALFYNPISKSYFLPRGQDIFPAICQYYKAPLTAGTVMKRPPFVPLSRFVAEIEFFQLRPQAVIDLFEAEGIRLEDEKLPENPARRYWYLVLHHPHYNALSKFIMVTTMVVTIAFVCAIVLESVPAIWQSDCLTALVPDGVHNFSVLKAKVRASASADEYLTLKCPTEIVFFAVETICTAWLAAEFLARFIVVPDKCFFMRQVTNWLDFLAVFPYIFTVIEVAAAASPYFYVSRTFGLFKTLRLLRLVSILKFSRYVKRIQMIFVILRSTWSELLMLCYLMLINSIVFGTIIFAVEYDNANGAYNSIPRGMYWAWITMLTIGYGDIAPQTTVGKVVGGACSILGIVFWTLPMTLISDHFAKYQKLFEGQEYMMACLSRMTRLREHEMRKRTIPSQPDLQKQENESAHQNLSATEPYPRASPNDTKDANGVPRQGLARTVSNTPVNGGNFRLSRVRLNPSRMGNPKNPVQLEKYTKFAE